MENNKQHIWLGVGAFSLVLVTAIIAIRLKPKPKIDTSFFDSPDIPGSGQCMNTDFLDKLRKLEKVTKLPVFEMINSGARSTYWNTKVGGVQNSSHKIPMCSAADIKAPTIAIRNLLVVAAKLVGFKRIGVGKTFVHVDNDPTKKQNVAWGYPSGTMPPINPFT